MNDPAPENISEEVWREELDALADACQALAQRSPLRPAVLVDYGTGTVSLADAVGASRFGADA